jgi:phosphoglycerate kinase
MVFFKRTIRDVPLDKQTVLIRADYNVPLTSSGKISDDLRIRASIPTLEYLIERGCKIVIMSHLGRPDGRDSALSLEPIAERLAHLLKRDIRFVDDCVGDKVYQVVKRAPVGSIIVLENLRYYKEEEADDHDFAQKIAKATGAKYFVQDGFGVVHRAHASTHAITLYIPSVAGLLLEHEYTTITGAMEAPKRPLVAIMGGAKVSDKIGVIERFVHVADKIIIGGAMANTFLAYKGCPRSNLSCCF